MNTFLSVVLFSILRLAVGIALAMASIYYAVSGFSALRDKHKDIKEIFFAIFALVYSIMFLCGSIIIFLCQFI